ncbi:MAG: hypothetical protein P9E88_13690 [Candidatus Competibacter sp.]|nr:hypothetical protein [Candidatus Competibacter sp.]
MHFFLHHYNLEPRIFQIEPLPLVAWRFAPHNHADQADIDPQSLRLFHPRGLSATPLGRNRGIMAYFDAFISSLFRCDSDGRRVFVPFGKVVYLVSDLEAKGIERWVKIYHGVSFATIIAVQILVGWQWNLVVVPISLICYFALLYWLVGNLHVANLKTSELPRISRGEVMKNQAIATGKFTLWALLILGIFMTAVSVLAAFYKPILWFGAVFFGGCTVVFVIQLFKLK